MSRIYKSTCHDLFGSVSFCGGGGGGGGGAGYGQPAAPNTSGPYDPTGQTITNNEINLDLNGNGQVTDEITAAATIIAGVATGVAAGWTGAGCIAAGATITAAIAGYADASR